MFIFLDSSFRIVENKSPESATSSISSKSPAEINNNVNNVGTE